MKRSVSDLVERTLSDLRCWSVALSELASLGDDLGRPPDCLLVRNVLLLAGGAGARASAPSLAQPFDDDHGELDRLR